MILADYTFKRAPLKPGEMLASMLVLAVLKFQGKSDKAGKPYILHCLAVMHKMRTEDEELQCMGLGHDLIEDCGVTAKELLELGFSQRVVDGICALTKWPGQPYESYKEAVKANPDAVKVKKSDLMHNSDLRRLKGTTEKDIARTVKYMQFYEELTNLEKTCTATHSEN